MQLRFLGELGLADLVTAANAAIGFIAVVVAFADPEAAARLILLAAIADGLDGVVARIRGGTAVGPLLDSLADIVSFGVAPAVVVYVVATGGGTFEFGSSLAVAAVAIPAVYVSIAAIRLGFYMLHDSDRPQTEGVQTTLSATVIVVSYLAGVVTPTVAIGLAALFTILMVAPITYPDLYARDAVVLGGLQALTVAFPAAVNRVFPRSLLIFAVAYLVLAPSFYWRGSPEET
jgi:CDP-diacylglycerol--serine O-phosphatidyltransferase